jgi:hypothetical protein
MKSAIEEFLKRWDEQDFEHLNIDWSYFVDGTFALLYDLMNYPDNRENVDAESFIERAREIYARGKRLGKEVVRFVRVLANFDKYNFPEKRTAVWVAYFTADNDCYDCLLPKPEAV